MNISFLNNITMKSGQLLNAGTKHCGSFNCMKSLKMLILTPKTSNNICAQSSAGYHSPNETLREKCPYSELFWSVFSRIRTEYEKIRTRIAPNTDTFHAVRITIIQDNCPVSNKMYHALPLHYFCNETRFESVKY